MRSKNTILVSALTALLATSAWAQKEKPNFSGTWLLNKEKSEMSPPPFDPQQKRQKSDGGWERGSSWPGTGGGRWGGIGIGLPGIGGPNMGGGRNGGGGMGGSGGRGGSGGGASDEQQSPAISSSRRALMADKLVIEHTEPIVTIHRSYTDSAKTQDLKITTDGKTNENKGWNGKSQKSKSHYDGSKLLTQSTLEGPRGKIKVTETRQLSADGHILAVELAFESGARSWTQRLVYNKEEKAAVSKPQPQ